MSIAKISHRRSACWIVCVAVLLAAGAAHAQDAEQAPAVPGTLPAGPVPRLVKFAGTLTDAAGQPRSGTLSVAFAVYAAEEGGTPLWIETQNVQADAHGLFTVLLGAASAEGLPLELFSSGEPRWLGVRAYADGEAERPRILLVSVPYALKAVDAETLGGRPASAFVMAEDAARGENSAGVSPAFAASNPARLTGSGTAGFISMFLAPRQLGDSPFFSTGGNIGLGTSTPKSKLDVWGSIRISGRGNGIFFPDGSFQGTAAGSGGGGGTITAVNTPAGGGLMGGGSSGALSLSLLTGCGAGQLLKWSGTAWACANDLVGGGGTVTSIVTGPGLLGGPIFTSGTVSLNTAFTDARYAQLGSASTPVTQNLSGALNLQGNITLTPLNGVNPTLTIKDANGSSFTVTDLTSWTESSGAGGSVSSTDILGGGLQISGQSALSNNTNSGNFVSVSGGGFTTGGTGGDVNISGGGFFGPSPPTGGGSVNVTTSSGGVINLRPNLGSPTAGIVNVFGDLQIKSGGFISFPDGSTLMSATGVGGGSITGVTAGTGLIGGGTSGNVTLGINPAVVPQLGTAGGPVNNIFWGNQDFQGNVSLTNGGQLTLSPSGLGFSDGTTLNTGAVAQLGASSNIFTGAIVVPSVTAGNLLVSPGGTTFTPSLMLTSAAGNIGTSGGQITITAPTLSANTTGGFSIADTSSNGISLNAGGASGPTLMLNGSGLALQTTQAGGTPTNVWDVTNVGSLHAVAIGVVFHFSASVQQPRDTFPGFGTFLAVDPATGFLVPATAGGQTIGLSDALKTSGNGGSGSTLIEVELTTEGQFEFPSAAAAVGQFVIVGPGGQPQVVDPASLGNSVPVAKIVSGPDPTSGLATAEFLTPWEAFALAFTGGPISGSGVSSVTAGSNIAVDNTNPQIPTISVVPSPVFSGTLGAAGGNFTAPVFAPSFNGSFTGDGTNLINLNAALLNGNPASTFASVLMPNFFLSPQTFSAPVNLNSTFRINGTSGSISMSNGQATISSTATAAPALQIQFPTLNSGPAVVFGNPSSGPALQIGDATTGNVLEVLNGGQTVSQVTNGGSFFSIGSGMLYSPGPNVKQPIGSVPLHSFVMIDSNTGFVVPAMQGGQTAGFANSFNNDTFGHAADVSIQTEGTFIFDSSDANSQQYVIVGPLGQPATVDPSQLGSNVPVAKVVSVNNGLVVARFLTVSEGFAAVFAGGAPASGVSSVTAGPDITISGSLANPVIGVAPNAVLSGNTTTDSLIVNNNATIAGGVNAAAVTAAGGFFGPGGGITGVNAVSLSGNPASSFASVVLPNFFLSPQTFGAPVNLNSTLNGTGKAMFNVSAGTAITATSADPTTAAASFASTAGGPGLGVHCNGGSPGAFSPCFTVTASDTSGVGTVTVMATDAAGNTSVAGSLTAIGVTAPALGTATSTQNFASGSISSIASGYNPATDTAQSFTFSQAAVPVANSTGPLVKRYKWTFGDDTDEPTFTGAATDPQGDWIGNGFLDAKTGIGVGNSTGCSVGQVSTFTGTDWTGCASLPTGGGGTVTQVNTATGITGGPITAAGTISLDTTFTDGRYLQPNGNGALLTNVTAQNLGGQPLGAFPLLGAANNIFTGGISASSVTGNQGMFSLVTGGNITANGTVSGSSVMLTSASGNIGSVGALNLTANALSSTTSGGVFINDTSSNGISLNTTGSGGNGSVTINAAGSVVSGTSVNLTANGSAGKITLQSATNILIYSPVNASGNVNLVATGTANTTSTQDYDSNPLILSSSVNLFGTVQAPAFALKATTQGGDETAPIVRGDFFTPNQSTSPLTATGYFTDQFGKMTATGAHLFNTGSGPVLQAGQGFSNVALTVNPTGGSNGGGVITIHGDLHVDGTKAAIVPAADGQMVTVHALETPESWLEDFGSGELHNGLAQVAIEKAFLETVNSAFEYHVFLTPLGDCRGLYVAKRDAGGFEVRELGGGTANIAFDYRIVAKRRGYETVRLEAVPGPSTGHNK